MFETVPEASGVLANIDEGITEASGAFANIDEGTPEPPGAFANICGAFRNHPERSQTFVGHSGTIRSVCKHLWGIPEASGVLANIDGGIPEPSGVFANICMALRNHPQRFTRIFC